MGTLSSARWRRRYGAAVALALVVAACSSGAESNSAGDEQATASSSTLAEVESADQSPTTTVAAPEDPVIQVSTDIGVDDEVIRIGYSLNLSGPSSAEDALLLDGHFVRIDAVNEAGGITGRDIDVIVLDNAGDPGLHQRNMETLAGDGPDAVLAIGGLSEPNVDEATIAALGNSSVLVVGNRELATGSPSPSFFVPLRPSVCSDTRTGIAALAASGEGDQTQLALLTGGQDWVDASADIARTLAVDLELELVLDSSFDPDADEAQADLLESLEDADAEMVWVAGSAGFLSEVAGALVLSDDDQSWIWGGTSVSSSASVFGSLVGPALADVYQVSHAGPLVDDDSLGEVRDALAAVAPELSYGEAAPAILGWQQADLLVAALEEAASAGDLTRGAVGSAGVSLAPEIPELVVYEIELSSARNATLSTVGASGLEELFTESDIPNSLANPCS